MGNSIMFLAFEHKAAYQDIFKTITLKTDTNNDQLKVMQSNNNFNQCLTFIL